MTRPSLWEPSDILDGFGSDLPQQAGDAVLDHLYARAEFAQVQGVEWDRLDEWSSAKPSGDGGGGGKGGKPTDGGGGGGGGKGGGKGGGTTDPGLLDSYTSGGDAATSYNIEIVFSGTWTVALQQAFISAADYLSSIILGDVADILSGPYATDDITIDASLVAIDGFGGVLGRAGPTVVRSADSLPAAAIMEFDSADAATYDGYGLWDDIILHEMIHSLGFGTLWERMGLTTGSVEGADLRFTGAVANYYYQTEFAAIFAADPGAAGGIPVETDGGAGTAGGHWDEIIFDTEIMTGYIDNPNFLSTMTIAALEDMGYDTVLDNPFDPYDLSGPMPADPLLVA